MRWLLLSVLMATVSLWAEDQPKAEGYSPEFMAYINPLMCGLSHEGYERHHPEFVKMREAPETIAAFKRWIRSADAVKCDSMENVVGILSVLKLHLDAEDIPFMRAFLWSSHHHIRQYAFEALLTYYEKAEKTDAYLAALTQMISDSNPYVRYTGLQKLKKNNAHVEALKPLLKRWLALATENDRKMDPYSIELAKTLVEMQ